MVRHPQLALLGWMVFLTLPEQIWVAAGRLKSFMAHKAELGLGGMGGVGGEILDLFHGPCLLEGTT